MTRGTIHSFDPARGTGSVCCIAGTLVPFSSDDSSLRAGDDVTFQLVGGLAGLYALDVVGPRRRQRQMATSSSPFRWSLGTLAPSAG